MKGKTLTLNKECILITICFTVRIVAHAEVLMKNCLIFIKKIPDGTKSAVNRKVRSRMPHQKDDGGTIRWSSASQVSRNLQQLHQKAATGDAGQLDWMVIKKHFI